MKKTKSKIARTKSPKRATMSEAFHHIVNKKWSLEKFDDFVYNSYSTGYNYGVQDIKDNYLLSPR